MNLIGTEQRLVNKGAFFLDRATMTGFSEAIQYNNDAVAKLQVGKLQESATLLKRGVVALRVQELLCSAQRGVPNSSTILGTQELQRLQALQELGAGEKFLQEPNSLLDDSFSFLVSEDALDMETDMKPAVGVVSVPMLIDRISRDQGIPLSINIFDQAFMIHHTENREELVCAAVFYNFALLQHKRCMTSGNHKNLRKALSLYEKAAQVAQNSHSSDDSIYLLLLAISNNVVQIHHTLSDNDAVRDVIEHMRLLLGECPSACDGDNRFQFFFLSVVCYTAGQLKCAAAA